MAGESGNMHPEEDNANPITLVDCLPYSGDCQHFAPRSKEVVVQPLRSGNGA